MHITHTHPSVGRMALSFDTAMGETFEGQEKKEIKSRKKEKTKILTLKPKNKTFTNIHDRGAIQRTATQRAAAE